MTAISSSDRARHAELKRQVRASEQADARRRLGLTVDELGDLLEDLESCLDVSACDHSLRFTEQWAQGSGRVVNRVAAVREFLAVIATAKSCST